VKGSFAIYAGEDAPLRVEINPVNHRGDSVLGDLSIALFYGEATIYLHHHKAAELARLLTAAVNSPELVGEAVTT